MRLVTAPVVPDRSVARVQSHALKLCAAGMVCATSLFLASPFVTLWTVSSAIQAHDMQTVGSHINWRALGRSVKDQALQGVVSMQPVSDELPDFGMSFASNVVSNAVDMTLTQANLAVLVEQTMPQSISSDDILNARFAILKHAHARFTSPGAFEAEIVMPGHSDETPLKISMKIQRWQWKITRIDFPTKKKAGQPVMEASASPGHA